MKFAKELSLATLFAVVTLSQAGRSNRIKGHFSTEEIGFGRRRLDDSGDAGDTTYGGKKVGYDTGKKTGYSSEGGCPAGKKGVYFGGKKGDNLPLDEDGDGMLGYSGKKGYAMEESSGGDSDLMAKKGGSGDDKESGDLMAKKGGDDGAVMFDYGGKKGDGGDGMDYGGKKGGDYGGKKGYGHVIPDDSCVICNKHNKNKPKTLTLTYSSDGQNSAFQGEGKASCRAKEYPESARVTVNDDEIFDVEDGDTITISISGDAYTYFWFDDFDSDDDDENFYECFIHTSCSVGIVKGDQIGPWIVGDGDDDCEAPPAPACPDCDICAKGVRPEYLTLRYHSDGKNSEYQSFDHASCDQDEYPKETEITVEGETFDLKDGDKFTITPQRKTFGARTLFNFDNFQNCFIHTSCSTRLIPGDQIGPFEVVSGPGCEIESTCIEATVREADGQTVIDISLDYADLELGREFVDNCDSRDENCPIEDLTPLPSDWIGLYPCEEAETSPPFKVEPSVWAYTCYDRDCRGDPEDDFTAIANITFSDTTLQRFSTEGIYSSIDQITKDGGGCYIVLLNRVNGFSAPPYYNICRGNKIEIPDES